MSDQIFELKDKLTDSEFKNLLDGLKKCHDTADVAPVAPVAPGPSTFTSARTNNRDWMCTNCNFKIFGSKSKCFKCGQNRP